MAAPILDAVVEPVVEVVYATPDEQQIVRVPFADGLTAGQAACDSGLLAMLPDDVARPLVLGVFGVRVALQPAALARRPRGDLPAVEPRSARSAQRAIEVGIGR